VGGFWGIFWLMIVLKVPVAMLLYLVWWAIHQDPAADGEQTDEGGGGSGRERHPRGRPPRPPRRGPHGERQPASPRRVRVKRRKRRVPAGHR
jgi:hypothetical protein